MPIVVRELGGLAIRRKQAEPAIPDLEEIWRRHERSKGVRPAILTEWAILRARFFAATRGSATSDSVIQLVLGAVVGASPDLGVTVILQAPFDECLDTVTNRLHGGALGMLGSRAGRATVPMNGIKARKALIHL